MSQAATFLLPLHLSLAVPLRIAEYEEQGGPTDEDRERVRPVTLELGARGDVLLYGGGRSGEVATLVSDLADGIAVLAFAPGGVKVFGQRYESRR